MNNNKWNPYVQMRGQEIPNFFSSYFKQENKKLLFILGKGFDLRMNITLASLLDNFPNVDVTCLLVEFNEGPNSSSIKYKALVEENVKELNQLIDSSKVITKSINLLSGDGKNKKRVGDKEAAKIIGSHEDFNQFTDVILDISALPRGVYSSLIGKILSVIEDPARAERTINFFVSVAENAEMDMKIVEYGADNDLNYLHGFGGSIELTSDMEKPLIWFPVLGEGKAEHFRRAFNHIIRSQDRPYEICPILPFPSKDLRRADALIIEFHKILFDEYGIEAKNIIYVPEQNSFEAYIRLNNAIKNYNESLSPLNGCKAVISNFSSKLLSIGTILTAHELREDIGVGMLNVDSEGYNIENIDEIRNLKGKSELFLSWLTGEPYND